MRSVLLDRANLYQRSITESLQTDKSLQGRSWLRGPAAPCRPSPGIPLFVGCCLCLGDLLGNTAFTLWDGSIYIKKTLFLTFCLYFHQNHMLHIKHSTIKASKNSLCFFSWICWIFKKAFQLQGGLRLTNKTNNKHEAISIVQCGQLFTYQD